MSGMELLGIALAVIELIASPMGALSKLCWHTRITEQFQSDEVVAGSQRQCIQKNRSLRIAIAGVCSGGRSVRYPVDLKHHAPTRDVEHAARHQKESAAFEFCGYQEKQRCSVLRWLRLVRVFAGVLLLYPACMLIMSNYAVTRGLLQGCSRFELQPLGHQVSFAPQCLLRPSPLAFFCASILWTVLEYIHYHSNAEDEFQRKILVGAVVVGLLLCVGCAWNALGVLIQTMPWIIHSGLIISDLLHGVWRKRCNAARTRVHF